MERFLKVGIWHGNKDLAGYMTHLCMTNIIIEASREDIPHLIFIILI